MIYNADCSNKVCDLRGSGRGSWTRFAADSTHSHDDVIKWKHFSRYWPFLRGIHRSPVIGHTKANDAEL